MSEKTFSDDEADYIEELARLVGIEDTEEISQFYEASIEEAEKGIDVGAQNIEVTEPEIDDFPLEINTHGAEI